MFVVKKQFTSNFELKETFTNMTLNIAKNLVSVKKGSITTLTESPYIEIFGVLDVYEALYKMPDILNSQDF